MATIAAINSRLQGSATANQPAESGVFDLAVRGASWVGLAGVAGGCAKLFDD
jgi:hypothetical protein